MDRQQILEELKNRGVNTDQDNTNQPISVDKNSILQEIKKRGLGQTKSGDLLPTPKQQAQNNPYGAIYDDMELPEMNTRSQAVEDFIQSKEFGRLALEVTAGVAGAAFAPAIVPAVAIGRAAMLVRPALQGVVTRMAGAGFGEAAGAGASQTFDPRFDSRDDFLTISKEVSKDLLRAFATGSVAEGAGFLINKGIAKAVGKNKKLIKGADEAVKVIEQQRAKIIANPKSYSLRIKEAAKSGRLTPALLQEGQTIDVLENIAELSLIGGGSIRYAREGAEDIAQSGLDDFFNLYKSKAGDEGVGEMFQRILSKNTEDFKAVANAKYKALDTALGKQSAGTFSYLDKFQVDLSNIKKMAFEEMGNLGAKSESQGLKNFLKGIIDEPDTVSFRRANNLRSDYLEISRQFTGETLGKKKGRLSAIASKEISDAMDNANVPDQVKSLLKDANKFYKEGADVFNKPLFQKIINSDPDIVYKSIVASGDRPNLIKETFGYIDKRITDKTQNTLLKNKIKGAFLKDFLTKSQKISGQYGVEIDAAKLNKNFSNKEETFKSMFSSEEIKGLKKFQNALAFAQGRLKKKGGLTGGIMIQMKQSGAMMQLLGAGLAGGAGMSGLGASIIIAPAAMAKAFTNPKIIKALTMGVKYNENQRLSGRYFRQAIAQMAKEGLIDKEEEKSIYSEIDEMKKN